MPIFIVTLVLIATLGVLVYPFVVKRARGDDMDDVAIELAQRLRRARDRVYEEIRALQQEFFLDNMPDEEYQRQLQAARVAAAHLMQQQQQIQQTLEEVDEQIELEMQQAASMPAIQAPEPGKDGPGYS